MANFAELDENNTVLRIIVVSNDDIKDSNGEESEQLGIEFCKNLLGQHTRWVQTSFHERFRMNFAQPGGSYDPVRDIFIPPCPGPTWIFKEETRGWHPPIPCPGDWREYMWDEQNQQWVYDPLPSLDNNLSEKT